MMLGSPRAMAGAVEDAELLNLYRSRVYIWAEVRP